jgi:hypothetical protein
MQIVACSVGKARSDKLFENDDPSHRSDLIAALAERGLDAWELNSGGGTMHVIVTLCDYSVAPQINTAQDLALRAELHEAAVQWPYAASLYIATNSLQTECEIGLLGIDGRTDAQVSTEEWKPVGSLKEAVDVFQRYWSERDHWLRTYYEGRLKE